MLKISMLLLLVMTTVNSYNLSIPHGDYCKIRWNHVMCVYTSDKVSKDCNGPVVEAPMTNKDRHTILLEHNLFRDKVASRYYGNPTSFGSSGEMYEMTWDYELEMLAQRWADQCKPYEFDHNRDTWRWAVNQNVYTGCFKNHYDLRTDYILEHWGPREIPLMDVKKWRGERNRLEPEVHQVLNLVWHNTKFIGCGRRLINTTKANDKVKSYMMYFVCNYAPSGQFRFKRPYWHRPRGTCTSCLCLHPYPNLCAAASPVNSMIHGTKRAASSREEIESAAEKRAVSQLLLLSC
ncbi:venom allergen 5 [Nilaparvata lugens]|uniref:venom allergen 5 n=1 Tax=Nilaparvata lugens TaxID=108931 RepID=UPI00193E16FD|nr:venom allergen 5 [Nilaparvata lugens]